MSKPYEFSGHAYRTFTEVDAWTKLHQEPVLEPEPILMGSERINYSLLQQKSDPDPMQHRLPASRTFPDMSAGVLRTRHAASPKESAAGDVQLASARRQSSLGKQACV